MELKSAFNAHFGIEPALIGRAPGRVNLLGEHVDYNDGIVLPAAIDRAVRVAAAPLTEGVVSVAALDLGERVTFRLAELDSRRDVEGRPLPGWALYPAGVAASLLDEGLAVSGMQAAYTSDVPIGAGLSSSAAVEVAFAVVWQALGGWQVEPLRLAQLCQRAENHYVGVNCGLMDQFASACGVAGHALWFDTRSLAYTPMPLLPQSVIVIADSGVRRTLSTSAYNERRAVCQEAVRLLRRFKPDIGSLRDISSVEFAAYSDYLPAEVRRRAEHVVKEIDRVQQAAVALQHEDAKSFGALMFASHRSLRDLYEVSCPELDTLVEIARQQPGCIGARLTGAGFGGCTVNLVYADQAQSFIQGLVGAYEQRTHRQAQVYLCHASQGAHIE